MKTQAAGGVLAIILLAGSASAEDYFKAPNGHWCTGNRQHIGCMLSTETVSGITASVTFDENGRSVDYIKPEKPGVVTLKDGRKVDLTKEPAVVWCEGVQSTGAWIRDSYREWYTKEICGMSDGTVRWRKK
jgi:hypothetical protein